MTLDELVDAGKKVPKIGVIVGRFQVPKLTPGHWDLLLTARRDCTRVIVGIGTAPEQDKDNPLSTRAIDTILADAREIISYTFFVKDTPGEDVQWVLSVEDAIARYGFGGPHQIVLYGGEDSSFLNVMQRYSKHKDIVRIPRIKGVSGTDVRGMIRQSPRWSNEYFREGVIFATK